MASTSQAIPYTASPTRLIISDLLLWARITFVWPPTASILSIILPIIPFYSGALDELYPSPANLYNIILQFVFTTLQAFFLLSLPFSAVFGIAPFLPPLVGAYVPIWLTWTTTFILLNTILTTLLLNSPTTREFTSSTFLPSSELQSHASERWIFVNGVAASTHWLQSNLDRLSLTFRREILGIHNQTRGILFDLIECILERTFAYATPGTRIVYAHLLNAVSDPKYDRIVLILHSQGAIQGGLALDWLFATVPAEQLRRLEVYTFGCAANHFNNPVATTMKAGKRIDVNTVSTLSSSCSPSSPTTTSTIFQQGRILPHIEHYANSSDYVAKLGVLNFRPIPPSMLNIPSRHHIQDRFRAMHMYTRNATGQEVANRYVGRLFVRFGSGHTLNRNYLDELFPMEWVDGAGEVGAPGRVREPKVGEFMGTIVDGTVLWQGNIVVATTKGRVDGTYGEENGVDGNALRVKDVSRLWMYRNGMTP